MLVNTAQGTVTTRSAPLWAVRSRDRGRAGRPGSFQGPWQGIEGREGLLSILVRAQDLRTGDGGFPTGRSVFRRQRGRRFHAAVGPPGCAGLQPFESGTLTTVEQVAVLPAWSVAW